MTNFRSLPGVVEPVNRLFERGRRRGLDGIRLPARLRPASDAFRRQEDAAPQVEVWTPDGAEPLSTDERRRPRAC